LSKEYHVEVDPTKLIHYQVPRSTWVSAIASANTNVGGNYIAVGEQAFNVRGIGFIRTLHDINEVVLSASQSTPSASATSPWSTSVMLHGSASSA
jgi:cobalt-zinc-cadmium resistance protein CzcA